MAKKEHLLTIVEPTDGGDSTLDLAHDVVNRGGDASVVMLITDRVRRNIADFASSENIGFGDAAAIAMEQLNRRTAERIGGTSSIQTYYETRNQVGEITEWLSPDTTAIAVPERLLSTRSIRKLSNSTGLPVVVTPGSTTHGGKAA